MLGVNQLIGFGAGGSSDATVTFAGSAVDTSTQTTYTFSSHPIGDAASDRYVLVAIHASNPETVSSVTVGGVSCTALVTAGTNTLATIWITDTPIAAGTTATVVVNITSSGACGIATWAAYGLISNAASDTATDTGTTLSATIDVPAGGILVAAMSNRTVTASVAVGGVLTEDYDVDFESSRIGGGSYSTPSAVTGVTVSAVFSSTTADDSLAAVSLR